MHISEISEVSGNDFGTKLSVGDFIKVTKFSVKETDKGEVAEIETSNTGKRYSFGKAVLGKAKSQRWNEEVAKAVMSGLETYKQIKWLGEKSNWKGDNRLISVSNEKMKELGWNPNYKSKEAIIQAVRGMA